MVDIYQIKGIGLFNGLVYQFTAAILLWLSDILTDPPNQFVSPKTTLSGVSHVLIWYKYFTGCTAYQNFPCFMQT